MTDTTVTAPVAGATSTTETSPDGAVIFLWPDGTEFSNDADWLASQRMSAYAAAHPQTPRIGTGPSDDTDFSEYDDMDGSALKAAAKEKGVDLTGLKKVGEVRAALIAHDAEALAAKDADSDEDVDDEEDDETEGAAQ